MSKMYNNNNHNLFEYKKLLFNYFNMYSCKVIAILHTLLLLEKPRHGIGMDKIYQVLEVLVIL